MRDLRGGQAAQQAAGLAHRAGGKDVLQSLQAGIFAVFRYDTHVFGEISRWWDCR